MEYQTFNCESFRYLAVPPAGAEMPPYQGRFADLWAMAAQNAPYLVEQPVTEYASWREIQALADETGRFVSEQVEALKEAGYDGPVTFVADAEARYGFRVYPRASHPADFAAALQAAYGEDGQPAAVYFTSTAEAGWKERMEQAAAGLCPNQEVADLTP